MAYKRNLTGLVLKMGAFHFGQRNPKLIHFNGNHNSTLKNLPIISFVDIVTNLLTYFVKTNKGIT